jgi:PhnB protein
MQITPYLIFNGQCEAAFKHYADVLGGEITMLMRFGEAPGCEDMPPDTHDQVIHVALSVGDQVLLGSDSPPGYYEESRGMSVSLDIDTREEGERVFGALAEGGKVRMPFGDTFWAQGFGMCVDRFGTPWMVNAGQKAVGARGSSE